MKTRFKLLLLFFVATYSYAQKHKVLEKAFDTNTNTNAVLNLNNTNVLIEASNDGKMHFDYVVEFENYSKKEIKTILADIKIEATSFENNIHLETNSFGHAVSYKLDAGFILSEAYFEKHRKKDSAYVRKSKDSIIQQIHASTLDNFKQLSKYIKVVDDKGKTSDFKRRNVQIKKSRFVIKVPPYVKLNILAENSNITINHDLLNELNLTCVGGVFKAKHLQNPHNNVEVNDASLKIESIVHGLYSFKKVKKGMIAEVNNTVIESEFSKIEFGEIGENVRLIDFNSEFWFYNWASNFKRFDLDSEYSKIHFFHPKNDYSMKVVGNNTINYIGEIKLVLQPTRNGEKYTMLEHKPKGDENFSGAIHIDIIHGIIYSHEDKVTYINKDN